METVSTVYTSAPHGETDESVGGEMGLGFIISTTLKRDAIALQAGFFGDFDSEEPSEDGEDFPESFFGPLL